MECSRRSEEEKVPRHAKSRFCWICDGPRARYVGRADVKNKPVIQAIRSNAALLNESPEWIRLILRSLAW